MSPIPTRTATLSNICVGVSIISLFEFLKRYLEAKTLKQFRSNFFETGSNDFRFKTLIFSSLSFRLSCL